MEKIIEILKTIKPGAEIKEDSELLSTGILTSLDIVRLANALADEFDIEITVKDIIPENFKSVGSIFAMIEKLEEDN